MSTAFISVRALSRPAASFTASAMGAVSTVETDRVTGTWKAPSLYSAVTVIPSPVEAISLWSYTVTWSTRVWKVSRAVSIWGTVSGRAGGSSAAGVPPAS